MERFCVQTEKEINKKKLSDKCGYMGRSNRLHDLDLMWHVVDMIDIACHIQNLVTLS